MHVRNLVLKFSPYGIEVKPSKISSQRPQILSWILKSIDIKCYEHIASRIYTCSLRACKME